MQERTIVVHETPSVHVATVPEDLRVAGWERPELVARTSGETLTVDASEGRIQIACDESLVLYLPRRSSLHVEAVGGDVSLQALSGQATIGQVGGDVSLRDVGGEVAVESVDGDFSARLTGTLALGKIAGDMVAQGVRGNLTVASIGGDVSLRSVEGKASMEHIAGDLYARNARGSLRAGVHGDAALYLLQPQSGNEYRVAADGDLLLRLPADVNVRLYLTASNAEAIHVDFPGVTLEPGKASHELTLGRATPAMPVICLSAGDDLVVTSRSDCWDAMADFSMGMRDGIGPIPIPPDMPQRIRERVRTATERARRKVEAANRRMEIKLEATSRRAEARARRRGLRLSPGQASVHIGRREWNLTPRDATTPESSPSDEERLVILRMLQEKKITPEEAEKLLDALEGK